MSIYEPSQALYYDVAPFIKKTKSEERGWHISYIQVHNSRRKCLEFIGLQVLYQETFVLLSSYSHKINIVSVYCSYFFRNTYICKMMHICTCLAWQIKFLSIYWQFRIADVQSICVPRFYSKNRDDRPSSRANKEVNRKLTSKSDKECDPYKRDTCEPPPPCPPKVMLLSLITLII